MFIPFIWHLGSLGKTAFFPPPFLNFPLAAQLLCIFNKVFRQTDAGGVRLFFRSTNRFIMLNVFLFFFPSVAFLERLDILHHFLPPFPPSLPSTSSLSSVFFFFFLYLLPLFHFTQGSCRCFSLTASLGLIICIQINYLITDKCPAASPHSARQLSACNYFNHLLSSGAFLPYSCV